MNTKTARPWVDKIAEKVDTLRRRRTHLERRLEGERGQTPSAGYDRAEVAALDAALVALEYLYQIQHGEPLRD